MGCVNFPIDQQETDMHDAKLQLDRRDFLQLAAVTAAVGLGSALPAPTANAATGDPTDFTRWLDGISGKHRMVLDVREPNIGVAMAWAWVYLHTAPAAYGIKESELETVMVFRHFAIPLVLGDAAWKKYQLGKVFKIDDPKTNKPAERNPFYAEAHEPFLPDMALQKLIDRKVKVVACDMALGFYSNLVAKQMGLSAEAVLKDWNATVFPGITHAPSGLVAIQGAVERGCTYVFAGGTEMESFKSTST